MPAGLSLVEAAGVPLPALTAAEALSGELLHTLIGCKSQTMALSHRFRKLPRQSTDNTSSFSAPARLDSRPRSKPRLRGRT